MIELNAFAPHNAPARLGISAQIELKPQSIKFSYQLRDADQVLMDSLTARTFGASDFKRANKLWQSTCFEAFWGTPFAKKYYEMNVTADGRWNVYVFTDYRKPNPPEPTSDFRLHSLTVTNERLDAEFKTAIRPKVVEAALCAVLRTQNNENYYYSAKHTGSKPDFHLREGFTIRRELLK